MSHCDFWKFNFTVVDYKLYHSSVLLVKTIHLTVKLHMMLNHSFSQYIVRYVFTVYFYNAFCSFKTSLSIYRNCIERATSTFIKLSSVFGASYTLLHFGQWTFFLLNDILLSTPWMMTELSFFSSLRKLII